MRIIHDDFKNACKNTGRKFKDAFKGFVKPFKATPEQKIDKLQAQIKNLRKETR